MHRDDLPNIRLGDVIELKRGYDLPARQRQPGSVPIISSSGPSGCHDEAKVAGPGVVTGRYGTIGQVFFVEGDFWPLNTSLYVKDFKGHNPRFIYYFLQGIDWERFNDKSGVPGINRNHAHEAFVTIPPAGDHEAIAELLGALDDKIDLNRRMNETLEAMARAIFKDWFVDFGPTRAKAEGRAPYLAPEIWDLFPDALDDEGRPIGWYQSNLGDTLSILETGKRPRGGVAGIMDGIPSVGAESIVGVGRFDFSKTKYVPHNFFLQMSKGHVSDGDVLIYKDGGKPGELRPAVTYISNGFPFAKFCINEHVFRIRTGFLSQPLLYCLLSTDDAFWQMRERATGVAQPGLNQAAIKSINFIVPDDERLLRAAERIIDPLIDGCNDFSRNSLTLSQSRDLLLPKLMSGEIRLSDAEKAVEAVA